MSRPGRLQIPLIGITLHWGSKDGGPQSAVQMYGIECKAIASALVLRFGNGSRDAYHSHAFDALSLVLGNDKGLGLAEIKLPENFPDDMTVHIPGDWIVTARSVTHKVLSFGTTWVLSFRGPWADSWTDIDGPTGVATTLTSGRVPA